ncbi:MAG: tRNA (adenosine(37)-N6)-dimethylallyltransferase MiaA [Ruminococcus sp.]
MKRIKIISVVGPTASGKTALSIEIAKRYNGEIISADSMQIYRGMNVATAKPTQDEMQGIVHHLIDNVNPRDEYSVAQYVKDARSAIADIDSRGKTPILVGGTGLYVNSLLDNVQFSENPVDEKLRQKLNSLSTDELLAKLYDVDKESYDKLSVEKNHKRISRALEIYYQTGKPKSVVDRESKSTPSPYDAVKIGLNASDRQFLYDRINTRVDMMIDMGLLDEAKKFLSVDLSSTASKAIGYKEFLPYFNGECPLEECKDVLKMETRRYAKRQITWFKRDKDIHWFFIDLMSKDELVKKVFEVIDKG